MLKRSPLLLLSFLASGCIATANAGSGGYAYQTEVHPPADGTPQAQATVEAPPAEATPAGTDLADDDPAALEESRATLEPYGVYWEDPTYGTVWTPSASVVGSDFSPYVSAGHWAYGDDYVWVSDYEWGWLPFHYGRWTYIGGRGWSWVAGRHYRGAWVDWRTGGDGYAYVGWSPMAPSYYWRGGTAVAFGPGFTVTSSPYIYAPTSSLFHPRLSGYVVNGPQVSIIASSTRPWNHSTVVGAGVGTRYYGPPPRTIGIHSSAVVGIPQGHVGISRAQAYSRPSVGGAYGHTYARPSVGGVTVGAPNGSFGRSYARPSVSGGAVGGVPSGGFSHGNLTARPPSGVSVGRPSGPRPSGFGGRTFSPGSIGVGGRR